MDRCCDEPASLLSGHVAVASVITEQSWRRDDARALEGGVHECEIRASELVGQEPVDSKRACENDAIGLTVVKANVGRESGVSARS